MSESILRLKVSSEEYDNKLKQATNGLTRYVDECRKVGGTLEVVEKETLDYVRALGQMDTTSRTATGKLAEMKKTFVELSAQYKQMSDAEKNAPFGKALAASLDQLKPRIIDTKNQLDEINKSIIGASSGGGGLFSGLGDKMSGALQVFAGNMLTKAAGAVANLGSEMYGMVQQGIELARQGEGIRIAFERLGRGDILQGLREATHGTVTDLELMKAAVQFNDFKLPLDQLGTMLAYAQQKAKDTGQSVDYLVQSIVTGLGRKSLMILDNLGLSASEVKERMAETGDMTKAVGDIIREQMAKAGDYVETAADRATQANVSLQNKMEELGRKFAPVEEASSQLWTSMKIGILDIIGGPLATLLNQLTEAGRLKNMLNDMNGEPGSGNTKVDQQVKKLNVIKKAGGSDYIFNSTLNGMLEDYNRQIAALDAKIKDTKKLSPDQQASKFVRDEVQKMSEQMKALGMMRDQLAAGAKQILQPTKQEIIPAITTSGGATGSVGGSRGGFDVSKIAFDMNKAALAAVKMPELEGGSDAWEAMREAITGCKDEMADFSVETANWTKNFDPYRENMEKMTTAAQQQQKATSLAAQAAQNFGAALAGIDDPAMKAAGTVMQAIANIALSFSMAATQASSLGPYAWIAYMAAGAGALATTISTIHSLTGYQNGGVIKGYSTGGTIQGNSYSGDNIGGMVDGSQLIGLNAGEVVLNKAQQATLAQNLQGGGNIRMTGEVTGEKIVLVANRYFKRTGQGEIVTW